LQLGISFPPHAIGDARWPKWQDAALVRQLNRGKQIWQGSTGFFRSFHCCPAITDQVWPEVEEALARFGIDGFIDAESGKRVRTAKVISETAIDNFGPINNNSQVSP
jgi:hypothetical protein